MKKLVVILMAILMMFSAALADTVTMTGTVVATSSEIIISAAGGKVEQVLVSAGDHVQSGDVLATIATTRVYAQQDGTAYVFGAPGDAADTIITRYGAVAYIEPAYTYTISASTKNTYDKEANRIVHPGETVYLKAYEDYKRTGMGIITVIDGTSYTVEVISGNFNTDESVLIYRDPAFAADSRIGKGNIARAALIAYEGTGCIVSYAVTNGQKVSKGDLLFETIDGNFIPGNAISCTVTSPTDGVLTAVNVTEGTSLSADGSVATLNPDAGMRVEASVSESDLEHISIGSKVSVEFPYVRDGEMVLTGEVEKISLLAAESTDDTEEASYTVTIRLDSTEHVRYGMNVVVTTVEVTEE